MRISFKLALAFLAVACTAALLVAAVLVRLQEAAFLAVQERQRERAVADVRMAADEAAFAQDPAMLIDYLRFLLKNRPEIVRAHIARVGAGTPASGAGTPASGAGTPAAGTETAVEASPPRGETNVIEEETERLSSGQSVRLSFSARLLEEERLSWRRRAWRDIGVALAVVLPLSLGLALFLGHRLSRRILALGATLEELGQGRFGAQTHVGGNDEIGRFGGRLNEISTRLAELESMKRTFVASITHELRSPIAAIESCVRALLGSGRRQAEEQDLLRRVLANASRLGHFVTNMLDLARIERGRLEMHASRIDPWPLIEDAVAFFAPKAAEAAIDLRLEAPKVEAPELSADPELLTHLLANLISNALKFTPRGGRVWISAVCIKQDGRSWWECSVQDSGPGVPASVRERLFTAFARAPEAAAVQGTGLGLSVCKAIVELHGGTIGLAPESGHGARFYFRLPLDSTLKT